MKHLLTTLFILLPTFAQTASKIYTGFNHGAFWSVEFNAKKKADFLDGFLLARNLTTSFLFDSARLFTCKAGGTLNHPMEAFDAAVDTKTNLLLGFWISPAEKGGSPDENVKNEMTALEKGFQKHGQALSDLIIGLSVGSEDIHRAGDAGGIGIIADVVSETISRVKQILAASSFAQYMNDKPIGHVDTAKHAVVDDADFIGMTVYPYWNKDSIDMASASFQVSLENVKQRAGGRPVWIAETGWPTSDSEQHGAAVAGVNELQQFWSEVARSVFGKYTTFWYELIKDSSPDQKADWCLVDIPSRKPRIEHLGWGAPVQSPGASLQGVEQSGSSSASAMTSSSNISISVVAPVSSSSQLQSNSALSQTTSSSGDVGSRKTHVTITQTTTITPQPTDLSSLNNFNNPSFVTVIITETTSAKNNVPSTTTLHITQTTTISAPSISSIKAWCVTVANVHRNNNPIPVATNPVGEEGKCSDPPTFHGYPHGIA